MNYQKEFNAKKQHMWARFLFPPGQAYFMPSFSINAFYNHDPTWVINHNLGNKEPAIKTAKDKEWKRAQKKWFPAPKEGCEFKRQNINLPERQVGRQVRPIKLIRSCFGQFSITGDQYH